MVDTPMIPGARPAAPQYLSRVFIGDRSELPNDDRGRRIALDFNAGGGRGVELIVPKDITAEETELSEAYVNGVQKLFQDYGYEDYPVRTSEFRRGVKRKGRENSSGISNTFHTEPFFIEDEKARGIFMDPAFQKQYASLLDATLRKIPNSTVLAPHGVGADEGAVFQHDGKTVTERSLGMALIEQLAPGQTPTSEAEITRQQADPIAAIIAADQTVVPVSLNNNQSANDSIGQKLTASSASARMLEMPSMSQAFAPLFDATERMTLDIDTSPTSVAQRLADYRRTVGQQVSSPPLVMY